MEFLVETEIGWPADGDQSMKAELIDAEAHRARELIASGLLRRLWRVPGRWANIGLWEAEDATALHEAITSLPLHPWMHVRVRPLARHPSDPATMESPSSDLLGSGS